MKPRDNKHQFALYCEALDTDRTISTGTKVSITDKELMHRMQRILRLNINDQCMLFDERKHMLVTIQSYERNGFTVSVDAVTTNQPYKPLISCGLPLLKKQALEEAVYGLVECGITSIYLLDTAKVQRDWGGDKEYERLHKICVAAAEQSKNYALPKLHKPISLNAFIQQHSEYTKLFFDPAGASIMATISDRKHENICFVVGPEGDLTESEKDELRNAQFSFCHLTPTILRAQQAVVVVTGLLRTIEQ